MGAHLSTSTYIVEREAHLSKASTYAVKREAHLSKASTYIVDVRGGPTLVSNCNIRMT
jgi:hypothetical protein